MVHSTLAESSQQQVILDALQQPLHIPQLLERYQLRLFYGDLHNHTGYSDGCGRPAEALRQMRSRGLHFAAITDHGELLVRETSVREADKWAATAQQVAMFTDENFLAIRGFEWSSPLQGHSNVWCSVDYTGYHDTGDHSMRAFYAWLSQVQPMPGAQVLASFNHPGREAGCFDGCAFVSALDERIVALECFNREDDYGEAYFQALDRGWHVGAIGVSDHHGSNWGSPSLPRAGLLAPALTLGHLQAALLARRTFATRSPTLMFLMLGQDTLMGSRLHLGAHMPLEIGVWCDDPAAGRARVRLELWSIHGARLATYETRGLQQLRWYMSISPRGAGEHWFVARLLYHGTVQAYSSPLWVRWSTTG